jgi:hypothetical protein
MDYILMCQDVELGTLSDGRDWVGKNERLLPKNLSLKAAPIPKQGELWTTELVNQYTKIRDINIDKFTYWCSSRVLGLDRENAKKLLNQLGLSQSQTPTEKAKIALIYRCVSLNDSYWVKLGRQDNVKWTDIRLFNNPLNRAIALVALKGSTLSLQARHGLTAEVTTIGSYAKGWFRLGEDKAPYLYKTYGGEGDEVEREICASKVIDCFNVYGNVKYERAVIDGTVCSRCKVMTNNSKGIIHAADFNTWCIENGNIATRYAVEHCRRDFSQMMVLDYLIANRDRHGYNWGFFQSMNTGEILGLYDLYDHNNAFDSECMKNEDYLSVVYSDKTMKQCALDFVRWSELKNIKKIKRKLFDKKVWYDTFVHRCEQLGIQLI